MNVTQIYSSEKIRNASNVVINPATQELQDSLNNLITQLYNDSKSDNQTTKALLQLLKPLGIITSGTSRLNIDVNSVTGNVAQVTLVPTVTTVGTLSDQTRIGGISAYEMQYNMAHLAFANGIRSNITFN